MDRGLSGRPVIPVTKSTCTHHEVYLFSKDNVCFVSVLVVCSLVIFARVCFRCVRYS
jgi:hypothetical protein